MSRLFTNNKALLFIIAILLITNIVMIVAFFSVRPPVRPDDRGGFGPPGEGMALFLKKEVNFTPQQLQAYDSLRKDHRNIIKPLFKNMGTIKGNLYNHVSDPTVNDSTLELSLDSVAQAQQTLDKAMFFHFRDVRALCTPEQLPLFDSVVQQFVKKMVFPFRKPGGPPRRDTSDLPRNN